MKYLFNLFLVILGISASAIYSQSLPRPDYDSAQAILPLTVSFDEPIDPDRFLIRPGEQLTVTFIKTRLSALTLTVDAEGRLIHESFGVLPMAMKTLSQVRHQLIERLSGIYNSKDIVVSVERPQLVKVRVSGMVAKPGTYRLFSSQPVSEAIDSAGGIVSGGSHRRIELRGGPKVIMADLVLDRISGDSRANPYLYGGTHVHVPRQLSQSISVGGAVNRPQLVELLGEETLEDVIYLAGGFTEFADPNAVFVGSDNRPSAMDRTEFAANDAVIVRELQSSPLREIIITGEVSRPGVYRAQPGMTIGSLITESGGLTAYAKISRLAVFRVVEQARTTLSNRFAFVASEHTILQAMDSVVVPSLLGYITVAGSVPRPGAYPHSPNKTVQHYLTLSGLLEQSDRLAFYVFDHVTGQTHPVGRNTVLNDGDELYVREQP